MDDEESLSDFGTHIDDLIDDCLIHIFSFLPIIDRVRIQRVSKRWKEVSQESWRTVKSIKLTQEFWGINSKRNIMINRYHLVTVLEQCGKYVTDVDLTSEYPIRQIRIESCKFIVNKIFNLCPRITSLNLGRPPTTALDVTLECVLINFKELTRLAINIADLYREDTVTGILLRNPRLKSLTLLDSASDGFCLSRLNHGIYEELHFERCRFQSLEELYKMLRKTKVLHTFKFNQCRLENRHQIFLLHAISLNHNTLRKLDLHFYESSGWDHEDPNYFSSLVNLEVLKLRGRVLVNDYCLKSIGKCTKLKEVILEDSDYVSDDGLGSITSLPELRYLRLNSLDFVTDKVFSDMPKIRKLECIRCASLGNDGFLDLLETSSSIEYVELELYYISSLGSPTIRPSKIIEAGIKSKRNKLTIKIEAEFVEPADCIFFKNSITKFDGRVIRKTMKLCLECFRKPSTEIRECKVCRDTEEIFFIHDL